MILEHGIEITRAEAWLDLVQHAAFTQHVRLIKGNAFPLRRGSLVASVRWLSDRWSWSNTKVCQFLETLKAEQMITTEKHLNTTVIFLCNYDIHNPSSSEKNDAETPPARRPAAPSPVESKRTLNRGNRRIEATAEIGCTQCRA